MEHIVPSSLPSVHVLLNAVFIGVCTFMFTRQIARLTNEEHTFERCRGIARRSDRKKKTFGNDYFVNKDGLYIFYRTWIPKKSKLRAIVVISHGFGEHCGRYDAIASELARRGFAVFAFDHQGHGKSEGDRGYVKRFADYGSDVIQMTHIAKKTFKHIKPSFLVGHSMGGCIAVDVGIRAPNLWTGVVLSGPLLIANPGTATPTKKFFAGLFSSILPKLSLDKVDAEEVSSDPIVNSTYLNDPLVYTGGIRARWASEVMKTWTIFEEERGNWTLPFWIGHGTCDRLCMPAGSVNFHAETGTPKKEKCIVLYEGLRHEIFNEDLQRDADTLVNLPISDAVAWMESRLS